MAAAACLIAVPAFAGTADDFAAALDHAKTAGQYKQQAEAIETAIGKNGSALMTQLARAYYLMGEAEKKGGAGWFDKAVSAADLALKSAPDDSKAAYWRSMALLRKSDLDGGLSALGWVKDALKGLAAVAATDPSYDYAGAYRSMGKVLIEAPGWSFIGDKKKGLAYLEKAKEIAPGFPMNRLYLAQAYQKNGMKDKARAEAGQVLNAPQGGLSKQEHAELIGDAKKLLGEL
ncbi:MAG TPA: hypothetical protein VGK71_02680 [Nitrospirota bacterium]